MSNENPARRIWFQREFQLGLPPEAFPDVLERVRGTPARLEEQLAGLAPESLVTRIEGRWSIQENAGHLGDLEALWLTRLAEIASRSQELTPADLENRKTEEAGHNNRPIAEILRSFRSAREETVRRLEAIPPEGLLRTALHPRLRKPMSLVDLFFFVAEHDDHHLARITEVMRMYQAVR